MKQFIICLAMLLCTIFMYAVVSFLEKAALDTINTPEDGSWVGFGVFEK